MGRTAEGEPGWYCDGYPGAAPVGATTSVESVQVVVLVWMGATALALYCDG